MTKPIDIKEISTRNKDFELALKKVCRRIDKSKSSPRRS